MSGPVLRRAGAAVLLAVLPVLFVVFTATARQARGAFWLASNFDPEYAYLMNSLRLATAHRAYHSDHPGTTVQFLGAATLRASHPLAGSQALARQVLGEPERYLRRIDNVLVGVLALTLAGVGALVFRATRNLALALLLQLTPFLAYRSLHEAIRVTPEPLVFALSLAIAAVVLAVAVRPKHASPLAPALVLGVLCGLALATKTTFLPLLILPFVALPETRPRLIWGGVTLAIPSILLLAGTVSPWRPFTFLWEIARHTGRYGNGPRGFLTPPLFLHNAVQLKNSLVDVEPLVLLIWGAGAVVALAVAVARRLGRGSVLSDRLAGLLAASVVAQAASFLMVTKDPATPHHYLLPAFALLGLDLALVASLVGRLLPGRARALTAACATAFVVVLGTGATARADGLVRELRAERDRRTAEATAADEDARRAGCRIAYAYRCSALLQALDFGNYSSERIFGDVLQGLYPGALFYNRWERRFYDYAHPLSTEEVLHDHDVCVLLSSEGAEWVGSDMLAERVGPEREVTLYRVRLAAEVAPQREGP